MRRPKVIIIGVFIFAILGWAIRFVQSRIVQAGKLHQDIEGLYQYIQVTMYPLREDGSRDTDQEEPLCRPDDPSTPQNEADIRYGCTAFDRDHYPPDQVRPYPYPTNPAIVSVEDDYLLDVVPREMGPQEFHPLALRAQAIAARTYAYCTIHAWEQYGEGNSLYWGNCLRQVNNSNSFQVFVPYYFDRLTPADQQVVQDAVAGAEHLLAAGEEERGPIFAEFSADAYLRTVAGDYSYLRSVEDPISSHPDIVQEGHGRGMSQKGASRWARGNLSYNINQDLGAWSVRWEDHRQILVHYYYTGIHIRSGDGRITPDDRWNPLTHTIPAAASAGGTISALLQLQNTSVGNWYGDVVLGWQWTAQGAAPGPDGEWAGDIPLSAEAGEAITLPLNITVPPQAGIRWLHVDMGRTGAPAVASLSGRDALWFHQGGWPHLVLTVTVAGVVLSLTPSSPTPTPTPTFTPTPTSTPTRTPTPTPQPTPTPARWWPEAEKVAWQGRPPEDQEAFSRLLSRVRDEVMAPDPKGEAYIRLTYRYAPEVTALLLEDEALRQEVAALMDEVRPLLEGWSIGEGKVGCA